MALTVIAHFNVGQSTPFPSDIKGIAGEGEVFMNPNHDEGGVIVTSYNTDDIERLKSSFEEHLENNDLSALAIHRIGELTFCYSKTQRHIF